MAELARMTWPEAREALGRARVAILPVGSCEQHGPHMTLDTDLAVAEAFARRLSADLGELAALCPPVPYGLSEHHLSFPGTLTLRPDTFLSLLADLIESLARWHLKRVIVVNGHGGNVDAIRLAARTARRDHGVLVSGLMWAQLAAEESAAHASGNSYGHACEIETSVAMVLAPSSVRSELVRSPGGRSSVGPLTDPPAPKADRPTWFEEWTDDGALGDPAHATKETGAAVVEAAYRRALTFARHFADESLPGEENERGPTG
jgi:creatinine amidohydrolase